MIEKTPFTIADTNIQTLDVIEKLDFFDQQSVQLSKNITALEAWGIITANPMPMLKLAFGVRDNISSMFGVKKIGGFFGDIPKSVKVGQKLDFFLVEYISPDVLTLTVRDRHLDVMTCISVHKEALTITSSVKTHNFFGRIYMIPVAPAHRFIVRNNLKQVLKELA